MLKDITLGQFFPGKSIIHRLDPRFKIIFTLVFIVMLFVADGYPRLAVGLLFLALAASVSGIPPRLMLKSIKPIVPIIILTSVLNIFFIRTGDLLFSWHFIKITEQGVNTAVFMAVRIIALIVGTSLLTYTTSPIVLTDAIERLMSPLKKIKVPVHETAMIMTIALRFIPTLIEETDKIMSAQKARGADMESGNIVRRAKALVPVLVPLLVSSFRRAGELALAMECRCYHGGDGRTRMKQLRSAPRDYVALLITALFMGAVVAVNIIIG